MDRGTLGGSSLTDPGPWNGRQGRHGSAWGGWGLGKDLGVVKVVLKGV
jgi:hypothetical protein